MKLAINFSELLSYDEQLIWRVICEHSVRNEKDRLLSLFKEEVVDTYLVRNCWPEIKAYALGRGTQEALDEAICNRGSIRF